jgi:hypothetical protein
LPTWLHDGRGCLAWATPARPGRAQAAGRDLRAEFGALAVLLVRGQPADFATGGHLWPNTAATAPKQPAPCRRRCARCRAEKCPAGRSSCPLTTIGTRRRSSPTPSTILLELCLRHLHPHSRHPFTVLFYRWLCRLRSAGMPGQLTVSAGVGGRSSAKGHATGWKVLGFWRRLSGDAAALAGAAALPGALASINTWDTTPTCLG